MSASVSFRSALNGFNRGDVVSYIESLSAEHRKALLALQQENQALKEEKAQSESRIRQLQQEQSALQEQVVSLAQEAAELTELLSLAEAEKQAPADDGDACPQEAAPEREDSCPSESAELAAYRRAEAAERSAIQRANRLHAQLSELCETARSKYLESGDEIAALTADLSSGLSRLQEAFEDIRLIFDEAENAFDSLELPDSEA